MWKNWRKLHHKFWNYLFCLHNNEIIWYKLHYCGNSFHAWKWLHYPSAVSLPSFLQSSESHDWVTGRTSSHLSPEEQVALVLEPIRQIRPKPYQFFGWYGSQCKMPYHFSGPRDIQSPYDLKWCKWLGLFQRNRIFIFTKEVLWP